MKGFICCIIGAFALAIAFWSGIWVLNGLANNTIYVVQTKALIAANLIGIAAIAVYHHNNK